jgi:hypothetical protein
MTTISAPLSRKELESAIVTKASHDSAFKQKLLRQPTETILDELGLRYAPENVKFNVLEETPEDLYLVLPMEREQIASLANNRPELSAEEFQMLVEVQAQAVQKCAASRGHGSNGN